MSIFESDMKQLPPSRPSSRLEIIGGPVDKTSVTLRFVGETVDPLVVSTLLRREPTKSCRKGDIRPDPKYHVIEKWGTWILRGNKEERTGLEAQIRALLESLPRDQAVWQELSRMTRGDLFCGLWLRSGNRETDLSPCLLSEVARRGLSITFDIYFEGCD